MELSNYIVSGNAKSTRRPYLRSN